MIAAEGFALLGTTLRVRSDDPGVLAWLVEFLTPAFDRCADGGAFEVDVATAPDRHRAVTASRPPGDLPLVPCFARDRKVTMRPAWEWEGRMVIDEHRLGALYVLDGRRVEVLAAPGSERVRTAAMRVVREIAVARARADSRNVLLHGAAIAASAGAVVLAGPRETGKTTLLAYLARATGAALVANDRTFLHRGGDGRWTAHGVPTIVNVRAGTLRLLPGWSAAVDRVRVGPDRTLAEGATVPSAGRQAPKLSPAQLAAALHVPSAAATRLAAIVFPDAHATKDEVAIRRLAPEDARRRLDGARFAVATVGAPPTCFARLAGVADVPSAEAARLDDLAVEVPCIVAGIGATALADPAASARLLAAVSA